VRASEVDKTVHLEWDDERTSWDAIESRMEEIHYPPES